jgi:hypothetical protein
LQRTTALDEGRRVLERPTHLSHLTAMVCARAGAACVTTQFVLIGDERAAGVSGCSVDALCGVCSSSNALGGARE